MVEQALKQMGLRETAALMSEMNDAEMRAVNPRAAFREKYDADDAGRVPKQFSSGVHAKCKSVIQTRFG